MYLNFPPRLVYVINISIRWGLSHSYG
ncbi:hypothetical protein CKA15_061 [Listeria phage cka15]|nr:hypothetical protein CKA15_061 [Listeria phage cka15]